MANADCQSILESNGIHSRGGEGFGASPQYARVSLIGSEDTTDHLIARLGCLKIEPSNIRTFSMAEDEAAE
jgi:aspartate/methionine/tyrosine aminotransferase